METWTYIISGLTGLTTGAVGSLIAPWVKWGIEKRKMKYNERKRIINNLKSMAEDDDFDRFKFIKSIDYMKIRSNMNIDTVNDLEKGRNHISVYTNYPAIYPLQKSVLEELAKIEKDWKIY